MEKQKTQTVRRPLSKVRSAEGDFKKPGVFILFKGALGNPSYVGRSDSSLFEGLMAHHNSKVYQFYKIFPCHSSREAFHLECMFWHKAADTLDNGAAHGGHHPLSPMGSGFTCEFPGCEHIDRAHQGQEAQDFASH